MVTPSTAVESFVIAAAAIEPLLVASIGASVADTLTAGDVVCAEEGFAKVNVAVNAVSLVIPDAPTVSTSCPAIVHTPVLDRAPGVDPTVKAVLSGVAEPVSVVIVTLEPASSVTSAVSDTVIRLLAPDTGVLC